MKKLVLLSLTLVAAVLALSNVAKAATATVDLEITGTTGSCSYGVNTDLASHAFSTSTYTMQTGFLSNLGSTSRICSDTAGVVAWTFDIDVTSTLTDAQSHTIIDDVVWMQTDAITVANQSLTFAINSGSFNGNKAYFTAPRTIFAKTSDLGTVGEVTAPNVVLGVDVPAAKEIGQYQGTITITVPSL